MPLTESYRRAGGRFEFPPRQSIRSRPSLRGGSELEQRLRCPIAARVHMQTPMSVVFVEKVIQSVRLPRGANGLGELCWLTDERPWCTRVAPVGRPPRGRRCAADGDCRLPAHICSINARRATVRTGFPVKGMEGVRSARMLTRQP